MSYALTLSPKRLALLLQAVNARIEAKAARYQIEPPSEDAAGDCGNDLHLLRVMRDELIALPDTHPGTARDYECWSDPDDGSLTLSLAENIKKMRSDGLLSKNATLNYAFIAQTGEEAVAIRNLREGWAPYLPMGEPGPCPNCAASFYPMGHGDCWRCGHIG